MENSTDNNTAQKILIVEDDEMIRKMYLMVLSNAGYEVTAVEDGETAYNKILENDFDAILLDIMLPKKSGIDILKELKAAAPAKIDKKVIMLTNLDNDSIIYESLALGATGYLVKEQILPDDLVNIVKDHFHKYTA